jgi:hypothetical protein
LGFFGPIKLVFLPVSFTPLIIIFVETIATIFQLLSYAVLSSNIICGPFLFGNSTSLYWFDTELFWDAWDRFMKAINSGPI